MCLKINIILIVLSYNCLTICSFQFGFEKYYSAVSGASSKTKTIGLIPGKLSFINLF